jgi:hypothetical protein
MGLEYLFLEFLLPLFIGLACIFLPNIFHMAHPRRTEKIDCPQSLYACKAKKELHISEKEAVLAKVVQQSQIKNTCVGYET